MTDGSAAINSSTDIRPSSVPESFPVTVRGFEGEQHARTVGQLVGEVVKTLGRHFDLCRLDGVTIAGDYGQSLIDLDRGYETSHRLTASDGHAIGVAMTPSVLRDGALKSHIVLNAHVVSPIQDAEHEGFLLALHIIAHECAHVEITTRFDQAFPGVLLRERFSDSIQAYRGQVIQTVWDEYAATLISAGFGADPTEGYENTFLTHLVEARQVANDHITRYRSHGNVNQVLAAVYGTYGDLLKFAAYHLGNLNGQGIAIADRPRTVEALVGHWFAPYFHQLDEVCAAIAAGYGRWTDRAIFEVIGDIADNLLNLGGVYFRYPETGHLHIDIPLTAETMPVGG